MWQNLAIYSIALSLAACSAGGGAGDSGVTKPQKPSVSPSTSDSSTITPPSTTNTGDSKCWAKLLDTPQYTQCKGANKLYNRVKKTCIELGITSSTDCSFIPANEVSEAKARILKVLPDSNPDLDQCGTYTLLGKAYRVAYIMGKQFSETSGTASYKTQLSLICLPAPGTTTCDDSSLKLSDAPPSSNQLDCN